MRDIFKNGLFVLGGVLALSVWGASVPAVSGSRAVLLNVREYQNADRNSDGKLTLQEFDDYTIAIFSALDKNHNKVLDEVEYKSASPDALRVLDIDSDRRIVFQEVMRSSHKNFIATDKNGDKKVTMREVTSN